VICRVVSYLLWVEESMLWQSVLIDGSLASWPIQVIVHAVLLRSYLWHSLLKCCGVDKQSHQEQDMTEEAGLK
jgi:hypothetical protein